MVTYAESLESDDARKAYNREKSARYRAKNRDKLRAAAAKRREQMGAEAYCEYQKEWQAKNPDKVRQYRQNGDPEKRAARQRRYYDKHKPKRNGQRVSLRLRRLEEAAGRPCPDHCDVCGSPAGRHGKSRLCFDHCHQSGEFRGWLCNGCNLALGYAQDNPDILRKLADYLEHGNPHTRGAP